MITFVIFTYNEEARIERVIQNFKNFGKILLADNKSTDRTLEIAQEYGCDVYIRNKEYIFVENQELVDELYKVVTTDWIYWGFADEMLEFTTLQKIKSVIESNQYSIIDMVRKNYFYGNFCENLYQARTFKVFKKHAIDFIDNPIHSMGKATVPKTEILSLPEEHFIHHFISNTASSYLNVINRYTAAELEYDFRVKTSIFSCLLLCFKIFVKDLIHSKGFRGGFSNLALTQLMIFYALVKNMKKYEQLKDITTPTIEEANNLIRNRILNNLKSYKNLS